MRIILVLLLMLPVESLFGISQKHKENDKSFAESLESMSIPDEFKLKEVILGNKNAPNTVIMYFSSTCQSCREFHEKELPTFIKKYVDTGVTKVYLRPYLDDLGSLESSILVICFGGNSGEKILTLYKKIFERQKSWLGSQDPAKFLRKMFIDFGYNKTEIEKCIGNTRISAGLMKEQQRSMLKFKVAMVPTFIVNGKIHRGMLTCQKIAAMFAK
ncbi:MAG: DsbA family protein [Holosporaceae bacterium]|nr:DsbA family protein [Holosporaceae bacterium]